MTEFLQYLFGRLKAERPVTVKVGAQDYAVQDDGTLGLPVRELAPQFIKPTFKVATLSALAAAVAVQVDDFGDAVALHVVDYRTVQLVSVKADEFGHRHVFAEAKHDVECPFRFNEYMAAEKFLIDLKTSFLTNDEAVKVQKVVSSLESGQTISMADDGMSQQLEIKGGTVSKSQVVLPSDGIPLIPWRTFRDADPVESKFLLRLKQVKDDLPLVALYDIDQKWKLDTVNSVARWLAAKVEGVPILA
ncbi:MAG: hypothetical protein P4L40_21605 [Terracidiphilus sp.]|nr:hypothetical protein [Terracidiphilus sp.]